LFEFFTKTVAPAQITHFLSESNLPAGDRTAAPDLSSASVATSDASRFTGSLNFAAYDSATIAHPQCDCGAVGRTQMHLKHFGVADQERQCETLGGVKLTLVVLAASWVV
jgi:hypothetical protein